MSFSANISSCVAIQPGHCRRVEVARVPGATVQWSSDHATVEVSEDGFSAVICNQTNRRFVTVHVTVTADAKIGGAP